MLNVVVIVTTSSIFTLRHKRAEISSGFTIYRPCSPTEMAIKTIKWQLSFEFWMRKINSPFSDRGYSGFLIFYQLNHLFERRPIEVLFKSRRPNIVFIIIFHVSEIIWVDDMCPCPCPEGNVIYPNYLKVLQLKAINYY